ncbi:helix-turn-helix transcriptional regulator [Paraflavisolibacter sp. H34]|uniref:helix-turn-helix transcriptional regulator n=1 Tax=Huijunlia imazamoxiresistens TaxID=3127457 RepID=UPI003016DC44
MEPIRSRHPSGALYAATEVSFADKLAEVLFAHLDDPGLDVDKLARLMHMSRAVLYRKIKAACRATPKKLINDLRLRQAAGLLQEGRYKIYEVADRVGYRSQTVFGRNFAKQFGMNPSVYQGLQETG